MGTSTRIKINKLIKLVGLEDKAEKKVKTYSYGMKQRLAIALALIGDPDLLIFDEPTNGMDPEGIAFVRNLIAELSQKGKTILLASHLLSEVEQICTHLVIVKNGSTVKQGEIDTLLKEKSNELEIVTPDYEKAAILLIEMGYNACIENGRVILTAYKDSIQQITALLVSQAIRIEEIKYRKSTLEKVFFGFYSLDEKVGLKILSITTEAF